MFLLPSLLIYLFSLNLAMASPTIVHREGLDFRQAFTQNGNQCPWSCKSDVSSTSPLPAEFFDAGLTVALAGSTDSTAIAFSVLINARIAAAVARLRFNVRPYLCISDWVMGKSLLGRRGRILLLRVCVVATF